MRLIDADPLIGTLHSAEFEISDDRAMVYRTIDKQPTIDAVPVVHGKWIPVTNGRGGSECNICHAYAPSLQSGVEYSSPYCPSCGAKMGVEE